MPIPMSVGGYFHWVKCAWSPPNSSGVIVFCINELLLLLQTGRIGGGVDPRLGRPALAKADLDFFFTALKLRIFFYRIRKFSKS